MSITLRGIKRTLSRLAGITTDNISTLLRISLNRLIRLQSSTRLVTISFVLTIIGTPFTFKIYDTYWNVTIFRVQTVDFNILSHTLPTKLSYAILRKDMEEVQRTVDSTYNLFGLIVTDPSGKNIIAYSGKNSDESPSWRKALEPGELKNHPYDVLLDPPPVFSQWTYAHSSVTERTATELTNKGRVIGRVYYVRGVSPTFGNEMLKWLSNPFSNSSRIQSYSSNILSFILITFIVWRTLEFFVNKIINERRLNEEREIELINNNRLLEIELTERIEETRLLQQQRDSERIRFENEFNNLHLQRTQLESQIESMMQSVNSSQVSELERELQETRIELQENLTNKHEYQKFIQELTRELEILETEQLRLNHQNQQRESELQEQLRKIKEDRKRAESRLTSLQDNEIQYENLLVSLQELLDRKNNEQHELSNQIASLQNQVNIYQDREQVLLESREQVQAEVNSLNIKIERYLEEIGQHALNDFEQQIYQRLMNNFPNDRVETQIDVGYGNEGSKFTDFLVVTNQNLASRVYFVIEAKSYAGVIEPLNPQDVRNSEWICRRNQSRTKILSCWGKNPYVQVKNYCDGVMRNRLLGFQNRSRFNQGDTVYGIIVFPSDSNIDENIRLNLSSFYRVITLNNLVSTIRELTQINARRNRAA